MLAPKKRTKVPFTNVQMPPNVAKPANADVSMYSSRAAVGNVSRWNSVRDETFGPASSGNMFGCIVLTSAVRRSRSGCQMD
jgi:hypothetical protein